jgi:hypothetical protein
MDKMSSAPGPMVTRRSLAKLALGGASLFALPVHGVRWAMPGGLPVVGFHADMPWLDPTGRDEPYHPPFATGRFAPDTESLMRLGHFL